MNIAKINSINTCCFEDESNMRNSFTLKIFLNKIRLSHLKNLRMMVAVRKFYLLYEMEIMPLVIAVMFTSLLVFIMNGIANAFVVK